MSATFLRALFEASHVQRWHTLPHLSDASLARHQWGVAALALVLCPQPTVALLGACLTHDLHERWSGDIPSPARRENPELLQEGENAVERQVWRAFDMTPLSSVLSEEERWWLCFCDMADAYLWTKHEYALGNQYVRNANAVTWKALHRQAAAPGAPAGSAEALVKLTEMRSERLSDYVKEIN